MANLYEPLLIEIAWEVCNQVGGIYTVIRTKARAMVERWGNQYCMVGPYIDDRIMAEFEPIQDTKDPFACATRILEEQGIKANFGCWLVSGRPKVVLLDPHCIMKKLPEIRSRWHDTYHTSGPGDEILVNEILAFGELVRQFITVLCTKKKGGRPVIAHFHEWLAGSTIPEISKNKDIDVRTVFTTHATQLGRYLAMNDNTFYQNLETVDWEGEAKHYGIHTQVAIERAAAKHADIFTTVSEVTGKECETLLDRKPDLVLPNGLNIERFVATHEVQNLHQQYKMKIEQFIIGHFFHNYSFDLDSTLYFFTSGRFEFINKGYDLTLEAIKRLNLKMKRQKIKKTIVLFIISKQPYHTINPLVYETRATMEELKSTCKAIEAQVGERMFFAATANPNFEFPNMNEFVDEYWRLRYQRTIQTWKSQHLPIIVTHNLVDDHNDEILKFLRNAELYNKAEDPVKVIYHPDFITTTSPLFNMEYTQFVRGCHLGIFPSFYEPWGYTPLECIASGVPTITSDLAGFGHYVLKNLPQEIGSGISIVRRNGKDFSQAADQLTYQLLSFIGMSRRERIIQRNHVESLAEHFSWDNLVRHYDAAYRLVMERDQAT